MNTSFAIAIATAAAIGINFVGIVNVGFAWLKVLEAPTATGFARPSTCTDHWASPGGRHCTTPRNI